VTKPQQQQQQGVLTPPSLEDYRLLVESIVDYGVFLLDPTGHVASWNRGAERIKGYAAHEIVGRHFSTFYPAEDVEAGKPAMELEVAKAEGRLEDEGWRIRKDGSRFWANVVITALRDASGELRGFAKVTRDLTQRRTAEEELRRSEERFRLLVEGVGDYAIYMLDPGGHVTTWNSGAQQLKGYSHDEIVGKNFEVFFTAEQREAGAPARELEVARTTGRFEEEGWRVKKDGTPFWANVVVTAIHSAKGDLLGYAKVTRDLSAKRTAELTARELIREQAARAAAEDAEIHIRVERERYRALSRRFEVIFEAVGDGILVQDRMGKVIFANAAAAVLSGLSSGADLVNLEAADLLERFEMLDEAGNVVAPQGMPGRKVMVGPERNATARMRMRIRNRHTGRETWNVVRASAVPGEDGQPELVVILWHDVTSEHRREERERYLARATGALASSLDHEAMLTILAGLLVPGLADWCSIQLLEEVEGGGPPQLRPIAVAHADPAKLEQARDYQLRYPPDPEHLRGLWNVVRTGVSELYADVTPELLAGSAKDADHLELLLGVGMRSLIAVPIRVRDRVSGTMTLVSTAPGRRYEHEDVVLAEELGRRVGAAIDNAKLFEQAQAALARAEDASRVKDEFLATVSHELRTPLNAVLGWASMLDGTVADAQVSKGVAVIHRNARAQAKIIDDILDVSRIITGKLRLELQSVDLAKIVRDAMEVVRPSADAKAIAIELRSPSEPFVLVADPERLLQVVWNLLSNAVKFTDTEGTVTATVACDGPRVTLTVTDTGRGIPASFLPHVFDRFKQADGTTTRRVGGLGLGLAIVRHIVELHGGQVRAASDGPGRGATFTVTLPVRALRAERPDAVGSVRAEPQAPAALPPSLGGVRVLVVDDEPDARELVFTVLELAGATVEMAGSAAEALTMLRRQPPDVLVSDLGMPDEDGFELMRQVRALGPERGGAVPAIALSAYTRGEDKMRAAAAGFHYHVS
jgi:PAS domain S-box-containing protein